MSNEIHKPSYCVTGKLHPSLEQLDKQILSHNEIGVRVVAAQQYQAVEVYKQWWEGINVRTR